jgi:XTP/dITP diphosphohydrolase
MPRLVVGTTNRKKGEELLTLLAPLGLKVETLANYPEHLDVVEDGDSFAANARLKAVQQARHLGRWVLAEDSGIAVDALRGAPGIFSARFSGEKGTDQTNNELLLEKLSAVADERRGAHYVCHVTLADPSDNILAEAEAICRGRILRSPRGSTGFGYDPLFEVAEYHKTFAELGGVVKSAISHRSRALAQIVPQIKQILAQGIWQEGD